MVAGVPLHKGTWAVGVTGSPNNAASRSSASEICACSCTASDSRRRLRSSNLTVIPRATSSTTTMIAAASIALPPLVAFGVTAEGGAEDGAVCWAQASPAVLRAVMKVMSAEKFFITHLPDELYQQAQCPYQILAASIEKIAREVAKKFPTGNRVARSEEIALRARRKASTATPSSSSAPRPDQCLGALRLAGWIMRTAECLPIARGW